MITGLIFHGILAGGAVAAVAIRPQSSRVAAAVLLLALVELARGGVLEPVAVVLPLLVFLTAALTLAVLVERVGLTRAAAVTLAHAARGRYLRLYCLVCGLCFALTAVVSLDGAVVLMVPLVLVLAREHDVPLAPFFGGVVSVANAGSIAVPQGNPTNLVVMQQLGVSPVAFAAHMAVPALAAAALCAGATALRDRRVLTRRYPAADGRRAALTREQRRAAAALAAAGLAAWAAPLLSIAPCWPFAVVVGAFLLLSRDRPRLFVPWRIAAQVMGLLVLLLALGVHVTSSSSATLPVMLVTALGVGAAAALMNNLPISASVAGLLAGAPSAYAASIGLAVGGLAMPQGSVATLIAIDLAGPSAPRLPVRRSAPLAASAIVLATLLAWVSLR